MAGAKGDPSEDVIMLVVCEKMKWTYQEFQSQPLFFIKQLLIKWGVENSQKNE